MEEHLRLGVRLNPAGTMPWRATGSGGSACISATAPGSCQADRGPSWPGAALSACFAEINRLGYRQRVSYQPSSRFWPFQWYETGIYAALALGLAGFSFWWLRRRFA